MSDQQWGSGNGNQPPPDSQWGANQPPQQQGPASGPIQPYGQGQYPQAPPGYYPQPGYGPPPGYYYPPPAAPVQQVVVVQQNAGFTGVVLKPAFAHGIHVFLDIVSCGLWIPVHILLWLLH